MKKTRQEKIIVEGLQNNFLSRHVTAEEIYLYLQQPGKKSDLATINSWCATEAIDCSRKPKKGYGNNKE
ncbi:helix-turn-helix domain-containing protein [Legionella fallonii]|uniref:Transposase n=1 Tax=Legionella fallonii LLAP-10 TaxID=1212491 RepID=A0A098G167_9GAMM|nr:hypothetical protein [Legionella fallonii]CEG55729.1 protein of unknown function [Legionella fallonii LLAP-10]